MIEKGPGGMWRITEAYNPPFYYYNQSDSKTPPLKGWTIGDAVCNSKRGIDPPTLKAVERCKKCHSPWKMHECYGAPKTKQGVGSSATWG